MSIAVADRNRAGEFWLNDAHLALMTLWQQIIDHPRELGDQYTAMWVEQLGRERAFFDKVRDRFNQRQEPADFLYLLARCVKAAIRYNAGGEFNNTPDNRRKGARPAEMCRRITRTSQLFHDRARLTAWDYKKVLRECGERDFVYMDPPYQGVRGQRDRRYLPEFDHDEFCVQLAELNDRNIPFAVSYDGRTGDRVYGEPLPAHLDLVRVEISAGRSTQATLLGRSELTYESLYISPALQALGATRKPAATTQLIFQ